MPDNQYPVFEGGQTLTATDLNLLRAYGHQRDRLLGRISGFGVNCGLTGSVAGTTLTIAPGLAVDQRGEPLLLPAAQTITLPPTAGATFDFVAAGPGGFSVVLEATETIAPAPDCGEEDCEGHAELHTVGVALRIAAGRITGPRFAFAQESLLTVEPMRLSLTSAPQGSYVSLRDAIASRLRNSGSPLISGALISKLESTSIASSDLPGVKGYKAGFINQVLFATLDLLRCRALSAVACDRATTRPGVVLGWVHLVGGTWTWECGYRHAWEPPPGLSQALVAGTCGDPCGVYVDLVESLIAGYAPPDPPPPPSGGGGVVVVPGDVVYPICPKGWVLVGGTCMNVYFPPLEVIPEWWQVFEIDPLGPVWNPPVDIYEHFEDIVEEVYGGYGWGYFDKTVVTGLPALGYDAEGAAGVLAATIEDLGGTANITVLTAGEVADLDGYEPAGTFNLADEIVLTQDGQGRVVATGRVPAAHTARKVGVELPAATAKATEAIGLAHAQQAGIDAVTGQVGGIAVEIAGLVDDVGGLTQFQQATAAWRQQVDAELGGVGEAIVKTVEQQVGTRFMEMDRRVSTMEGAIDILGKTRAAGGFDAREGVSGQRLDQDMSMGITEFADTMTTGLSALVTSDNERTLGRYVKRAQAQAAELRTIAAGGEPIAIGDAAVALLSTLRTAVKSAGVDAATGRALDAQFNAVREMLG